MINQVTDVRSNAHDQIAHAVKSLGRSPQRIKIFDALHSGKKKTLSIEEIAKKTELSRKRVLEETIKLYNNRILVRSKVNGDIAYTRDSFYYQNRNKILSLARNKEKLASFPTKTNPTTMASSVIKIEYPKNAIRVKQIYLDDIQSFRLAKKRKPVGACGPIYETKLKKGIQKIIGEPGTFQDWGGEKNDLFSTRFLIKGQRLNVAFAFKGKGTTGRLVPKKMGKNGDQIQRLFSSCADVFIIQYCGEIDESILELMKTCAITKSFLERKIIYFGIIDGVDTQRVISAYPKAFKMN